MTAHHATAGRYLNNCICAEHEGRIDAKVVIREEVATIHSRIPRAVGFCVQGIASGYATARATAGRCVR